MKFLTKATGVVSLVDDGLNIAKDWRKGDVAGVAWNATKGLATTAFMVFGGEEIEVGWNLLTMGVDALFEDDNN